MNNKGGVTGNYVHSSDWNCENCNYLNFKRNMECRRCKQNKNQWTCNKCKYNISNNVSFCNKCKLDKNGNLILNSDWICHSCFKINEIDYNIGQLATEVVCDCGQNYTLQNQPNLSSKLAYHNNLEATKKVYQLLNFFVDWDCLKNINCGISNTVDLLTRKHINKKSILHGIQYVVIGRDPDTGHHSSCTCNSCLGL